MGDKKQTGPVVVKPIDVGQTTIRKGDTTAKPWPQKGPVTEKRAK